MAAYNYNDWLFAAGFKFGFPLSIKYDQDMKDVDITAYYNFTDPIYNSKALGAGQGREFHTDGKYSEKSIYVMVGANIGRKFRLSETNAIRDKIELVDFKNIKNDSNLYSNQQSENKIINISQNYEDLNSEAILSRQNPGSHTITSSTLCSQRIKDGEPIVNSIKYFDFGIKLSILFSSYANGTKEAKKEIERKAALMQ